MRLCPAGFLEQDLEQDKISVETITELRKKVLDKATYCDQRRDALLTHVCEVRAQITSPPARTRCSMFRCLFAWLSGCAHPRASSMLPPPTAGVGEERVGVQPAGRPQVDDGLAAGVIVIPRTLDTRHCASPVLAELCSAHPGSRAVFGR